MQQRHKCKWLLISWQFAKLLIMQQIRQLKTYIHSYTYTFSTNNSCWLCYLLSYCAKKYNESSIFTIICYPKQKSRTSQNIFKQICAQKTETKILWPAVLFDSGWLIFVDDICSTVKTGQQNKLKFEINSNKKKLRQFAKRFQIY